MDNTTSKQRPESRLLGAWKLLNWQFQQDKIQFPVLGKNAFLISDATFSSWCYLQNSDATKNNSWFIQEDLEIITKTNSFRIWEGFATAFKHHPQPKIPFSNWCHKQLEPNNRLTLQGLETLYNPYIRGRHRTFSLSEPLPSGGKMNEGYLLCQARITNVPPWLCITGNKFQTFWYTVW